MNWPTGLGLGIPHQTLGAGLSLSSALHSLRPAWYYNWLSDRRCPGYFPMLWKPVPGNAQWNDLVEYVKATDIAHFLYNEPEWEHQSNTTPGEASSTVIQWRNAAKVQKDGQWVYPRWMGPGVMVSHEKAYTWLNEFINTAPASALPQVWAIHIYAYDAADWQMHWNKWKAWMWANESKNAVRQTVVTETASWTSGTAAQKPILDKAIETIVNDNLLLGAAWFSAAYGWQQSTWDKSDLLEPVVVSSNPTVLSPTAPRNELGNYYRQRSLETALSYAHL